MKHSPVALAMATIFSISYVHANTAVSDDTIEQVTIIGSKAQKAFNHLLLSS